MAATQNMPFPRQPVALQTDITFSFQGSGLDIPLLIVFKNTKNQFSYSENKKSWAPRNIPMMFLNQAEALLSLRHIARG